MCFYKQLSKSFKSTFIALALPSVSGGDSAVIWKEWTSLAFHRVYLSAIDEFNTLCV